MIMLYYIEGDFIYQEIINKTKKNNHLATFSFIFLLLNIINLFILLKKGLKDKAFALDGIFKYLYFGFSIGLLTAWLILKIISLVFYIKLIIIHKRSQIYLPKTNRVLIAGIFFEVVNLIAIAQVASRAMLYLRLKDNSIYKVKDIILIAIMALATIMFSGVMPLVIPLLTKIFGIAQLVTALPASFFFSIAIEKLKKPYALIIMSSFMALVLLPMNWMMSLIFVIPALFIELFNIIFIKGYNKSIYVFQSVASLYPLSLLLFYYLLLLFHDNRASLISNWTAIPVICATIILSYLGAFLGIRIVREISRVKGRKVSHHE